MKGRLIHQFLSYYLDPSVSMLFKDGKLVPIAPKTFKLLYLFVMHPRTVLTINDILEELYDSTNIGIFDYAVARQIADLRKALGEDKDIIKTTKGRTNRRTGEKIPTRYLFDADVKLVQISKDATELQLSEADDLFSIGRYHWMKSAPKGLHQAIAIFKNVIDLDPLYAEAHAAIADCWILLSVFAHQVEAPAVAMPKVQEAALRALSINPDISAAHYSLACFEALYRWDWQQAKDEFEKAINLDPANPMLRAWYALCLAYRQEHLRARDVIKEAIEAIRALPLNPIHYLLAALSGRIHYMAREFDQALGESLRSVRIDDFYLGYIFAGHTYRELGQYEEALKAFGSALNQVHNNPIVWAEIGHIHGRQGELKKAQEVLDRLDQIRDEQNIHLSPHLKAHIHLGMGDIEKALDYLEESFNQRDAYMVCLTVDSVYMPLYKEARFDNLVRGVGFVDLVKWQEARQAAPY